MAKPIRTYDGRSYFEGNVGLGIIPDEKLTVAGNISVLSGSVSAVDYFGSWNGNILSSSQVHVEGVDIKSSNQPAGLFLKTTGDGNATWDEMTAGEDFTFNNNEVSGDLIVRGDIIEYAANNIVFSKTSVFTGPLSTGVNTVNTFNKTDFKTAKYIVTLSNNTPARTAFEILVTHDGASVADGTTYGIVDAQATSLLSEVTTAISSTIDLVITTTANCTVTIYGVAHY
tara:strand:+ start:791 stop:1474 length:684 start_codon:yes stop_codon:yes gene_type:complete